MHDDTLKRFAIFVNIIDKEVLGDQRYKVANKLYDLLPDKTEFEDAPQT